MNVQIIDVIGYHVNKLDCAVPTTITNPIESAALYIEYIDVQTDNGALTTDTININGHAEEIENLTTALDQKMKGIKIMILVIIIISF